VIDVGDVILGVGGKPFSHDPRTEFGKALTTTEAGDGNLMLTRWRDGTAADVVVKLPALGGYSATAPYDCPKSKRILEDGCKALAKRMAQENHNGRQNPITHCLNVMALLASGEKEYLPLIRKEALWAADISMDSYQTWYYAYIIMLLSEYHMATGDDAVMPGLKRLVLEAANGQSNVGSWGHRFAKPTGTLYGYGMMNAPGVPLTISMIMARQAGVKDPALDLAIDRSSKLLRFYIGKGAVPYGDHAPWMETHEDNGKCGMAGVMFNMLGEKDGAEFFGRMSLAAHGPERDGGHTGNFTNILWSVPGVALSGPQATGAWMKEFGAWYFDLARTWEGSFPHQGAPEPGFDSFGGWDATGGYLLAYAMPLRKLMLTGKQPNIAPQIDETAAQAIINDGRGWDNKDRFSAYDRLTPDLLLECLSSWSPIVRERAAMAYARRRDAAPGPLIEMLNSPSLDAKIGACQALGELRGRGAPAVEALRATLKAEDLWLHLKAAEALSRIGGPAMEAVPELLEMLATVDPKKDPRGMQQRYLAFALFDRGGMLSNSLEGVDRELLFRAVRAGLKNDDGRARGSIGSVYRHLTFEEIKPLLPAIYQAVVEPSPSGIMFADQIRVEGLRVMATHRVEEGMQACVDYIRTQNRWASEKRIVDLIKVLLTYGAHAQAMIPELERIAASFDGGEPDFPRHLSKGKAADLREAITAIKAATERPELIRIK
jgi:hypothetical protein